MLDCPLMGAAVANLENVALHTITKLLRMETYALKFNIKLFILINVRNT
jgi:hypothetical protein